MDTVVSAHRAEVQPKSRPSVLELQILYLLDRGPNAAHLKRKSTEFKHLSKQFFNHHALLGVSVGLSSDIIVDSRSASGKGQYADGLLLGACTSVSVCRREKQVVMVKTRGGEEMQGSVRRDSVCLEIASRRASARLDVALTYTRTIPGSVFHV